MSHPQAPAGAPQMPPMPPHIQTLQLITGKWISQMLGVAAELRFADLLKDGPRSADELAKAAGATIDGTYRLLRGLTLVGVFAELDGRRFANTPLSEPLRSDSPVSVAAFARMQIHRATWHAWGELLTGVRDGSSATEKALGMGLFEYAARHPDLAQVFNEAMEGLSRSMIPAILESYDFSQLKHVVDVGGGHGHVLAAILARNPGLRGTVFDMHHAAEGAKELLGRADLASRCEFVAGDFFRSITKGGDAYFLKHIVHDWPDELSVQILKNCHAAMEPGGKLLVVEMVMPGPGVPSFAKTLDLEMLVMTPGGRERTEAEFGQLYEAAGFRLSRVVQTPGPHSIIEGVKR